MLLARRPDGRMVQASPGAMGVCPSCGAELQPKCGALKVWHWAHVAGDCDLWSEPESEWHLGWKRAAPESNREVVIGPHRADLVVADAGGRLVIELQHSPIAAQEIEERERFYSRMCWLFDAREIVRRFDFSARHCDCGTFTSKGYCTCKLPHGRALHFYWRWPRSSLLACQRPVFMDLGEKGILRITEVKQRRYCTGYGYTISRERFAVAIGGVAGTFAQRLEADRG